MKYDITPLMDMCSEEWNVLYDMEIQSWMSNDVNRQRAKAVSLLYAIEAVTGVAWYYNDYDKCMRKMED